MTPAADMAAIVGSLNRSPSPWLVDLAAAVARGDAARVAECQVSLRALGWIVLTPDDLRNLAEAVDAGAAP